METKVKNDDPSEKKTSCSTVDASDKEVGQIQNVIGDFGRYQFMIYIFKIMIGVTSAFNNLGVTFFAPVDFIGFECADLAQMPSFATNSSSLHGNRFNASQSYIDSYFMNSKKSDSFQDILGEFLFNEERNYRHSLNLSFETPKNLTKECKYLSPSDNRHHHCTSYKYDKGIWISSIIEEWDLVCNKSWFISMTQSLYMSGFLASYLVFGYISDRFGRWKSLLLGALIEISSGFGCAIASSVTWFLVLRFVLGLGNAGRTSSSYLIMIEWVGPKYRMHISAFGALGWAMGYTLMPWIALYFLHFRHMQLFICCYEIVFVVWLLFLPESPRWLLTRKRFDEAYQVLLMAAKFNGLIVKDNSDNWSSDKSVGAKLKDSHLAPSATRSQLFKMPTLNEKVLTSDLKAIKQTSPGDKLAPYTIEQYDVKFMQLVNTTHAKKFSANEDRLSIIDLFKWNNLRRYAMILFFVWASNSFIYYGIVLGIDKFGGRNLFVSFSLAGLTELPSILFTIVFMKFLPRKTTNIFLFFATGTLCLTETVMKQYGYIRFQQTAIMLAKLFNSCSFSCILYQTMELFPTSIRQTAYSSCSIAGRIGSILAPFTKELSQLTNNTVVTCIYAAISLVSVVLIRELPETKGSDLPDTLLEAEQFKGVDKKIKKSHT